MIDDPEIREIGRKQRNQKLKRLGIAVAVVGVAAFVIVPTGSSVAASLESEGYTQVEVTREGVFSFTYRAKKGDSDCTGSVTKMPGSRSGSGMCVGGTGGGAEIY